MRELVIDLAEAASFADVQGVKAAVTAIIGVTGIRRLDEAGPLGHSYKLACEIRQVVDHKPESAKQAATALLGYWDDVVAGIQSGDRRQIRLLERLIGGEATLDGPSL